MAAAFVHHCEQVIIEMAGVFCRELLELLHTHRCTAAQNGGRCPGTISGTSTRTSSNPGTNTRTSTGILTGTSSGISTRTETGTFTCNGSCTRANTSFNPGTDISVPDFWYIPKFGLTSTGTLT